MHGSSRRPHASAGPCLARGRAQSRTGPHHALRGWRRAAAAGVVDLDSARRTLQHAATIQCGGEDTSSAKHNGFSLYRS
eukprot:scaffold2764_cov119-Isochrysis_galbana.AAC.1